MSSPKNKNRRYSLPFILKVIGEVENGIYTTYEAAKVYNIPGHSTVNKWIRKFTNYEKFQNYSTQKETKQQKKEYAKIQKENEILKSALTKSHIKIECLETLIDYASNELKIDIKKITIYDYRDAC